MTIDWGSFPDWLAGLAAVFALGFAGAAAQAAWKASKIQARQIEKLEQAELRRAEAERRSQAERVAIWIRMAEDSKPAVVCFNGSGLPVYHLRITAVLSGPEDVSEDVYYAVKGPDMAPRVLGHATTVLVRGVAEKSGALTNGQTWSDIYKEGRLTASVTFVDVGGRKWCRQSSGELLEQES